MMATTISTFEKILSEIPPRLHAFYEPEFNAKPSPEKWSKKEIVGHLIDSAANNHQRFVRIQFEDVPVIYYDQNNWNRFNYYQALDSKHVIDLWTRYNQHLLELIQRIPEELLQREGNSGPSGNHTLQWLIEDYVEHMEHHLRQIFIS